MTWSPIQPKKQDNRKKRGCGVGGDRVCVCVCVNVCVCVCVWGGGGWTKFEKGERVGDVGRFS